MLSPIALSHDDASAGVSLVSNLQEARKHAAEQAAEMNRVRPL